MENGLKRAVIYCRVSTKEQVEEGNSLVTQERTCREYALKNGYEVVFVFVEQGESAKTRNRTELGKMLNYCADRRNNIRAVIAYKIDRISRNVDDYSYIRLKLKRNKVEIKSTSENLEDTPVGKFMENMLANVSQFDNDIRTERSVNGMREAVREGRHIGKPPYGYINIRVSGKSNIYPNDKRVFVEKAFTMVAQNNASIEETRVALTKEGMVNEKGKALSKAQFYRLLANESYAGWITKFKERHKGVYDPLISNELFRVVQYVLKRRSHTGFIYNWENEDFPLRRFVYNKDAIKLTGYWAKGRIKKYPYYRFKGVKKSDFRKETFEKSFIEFLKKYQFSECQLNQLKESLTIAFKNGAGNNSMTADKLKLRIGEIKDRQSILIQKNIKGVISDFILKEQMDLLEQELHSLYYDLTTLNEQIAFSDKDWNEAVEYLKNPYKIWLEASYKIRKKLQWFEFPHGVIFDNGKFRTIKVASIFNAKSQFTRQLSHSVPTTQPITNTADEQVLQEYTKQIKELSNILTDSAPP